MEFSPIEKLAIAVLVFITVITSNNGLTEPSSRSLVNTTISHNGRQVLQFEQQRYSRKLNTHFNELKIQWSYLYITTAPISVTFCSSLCMDHPECVSFFYNKNHGGNPNCFLNSQALRSDHYKQVVGIDYFELQVCAVFSPCYNYNLCWTLKNNKRFPVLFISI